MTVSRRSLISALGFFISIGSALFGIPAVADDDKEQSVEGFSEVVFHHNANRAAASRDSRDREKQRLIQPGRKLGVRVQTPSRTRPKSRSL